MPGHWRAIGSSARGFLHTQGDRGCDDAHGWRVDGSLTVVVTADGAGSRPGTSALGAHVAVARVLEVSNDPVFRRMYETAPDVAVKDLFQAALGRVSETARDLGSEPGRFATTLSMALVGRREVVVAQVGDGIAAVEPVNGPIQAVAIPDRFEYANEVVFLTAAGAIDDHLKVYRSTVEEIRSIALATDGLRYKILDDVQAGTPYEQFYADTWSYARRPDATSAAIKQFLDAVDDQTGDDKTLVVAVRDIHGKVTEAECLSERPKVAKASSKPRPGSAGDQVASAQ